MLAILLTIFVALQIADIASTLYILAHGGRELNPVARWFMARLGRFSGLVATKALTVAAVIGGVLVAYVYAHTVGLIALAGFCGLYALVVLHNWRQI